MRRTEVRSKVKVCGKAAKALERDLSHRLGLKVEIGFDGKGGAVTVHYQTLEQLDEIIGKLGQ